MTVTDKADALAAMEYQTTYVYDFAAKDPTILKNAFSGKKKINIMHLANEVRGGLAIGQDGGIWVYRDGVYRPDSEELNARCVEILGGNFSKGLVGEAEAYIRGKRTTPRLPETPSAAFINVRNGMFDIWHDKLNPHAPEALSTLQLPITYDPAAECPEFDRWLSEVVDPDAVQLVWELIGYMLMSGNPFQKAVLVHGPGGSGKSTFIRVLEHMLGNENVSHSTLQSLLKDKFSKAELHAKTANLAGDIGASFIADTSALKEITGGDTVQAQRKYGQPFSFTPFAVPLFSANEFSRSADVTDGYMRRWIVVPFPRKVIGTRMLDEQDLFDEIPGIFNRATAALRDLLMRGEFYEYGSVQKAKEEFKKSADIIRIWLDEDEAISLADAGNTAIWTKSSVLYEAYRDWSKANGYQPKGSKAFAQDMANLGFTADRKEGSRVRLGISVPEAEVFV